MFPIQISGLEKSFGDNQVLKGVDLVIKKQGLLAIVGENGSGKTVLMRILAGLDQSSAGKISWNGRVNAPESRQRAMILQRPIILRRTVEGNIAFALKRVHRKDKKKLIYEALSLVGLENCIGTFAPNLSGGQKQRLAIAQAWVIRPKFLLLDEPTANLDPISVSEFEYIVEQIKSSNDMKLVLASHDMRQVRKLADEVAFLNRGKLTFYESAKDFFRDEKISMKDYIGSF